MRTTDPAWFEDLAEGHVLRERSGAWRVVRKVSRDAGGRLRAVTLVIRRASWTGRATTTITATDLKTRGFSRVPNVRVKLNKPADDLVRAAIRQMEGEGLSRPYVLTARDVIGWP